MLLTVAVLDKWRHACGLVMSTQNLGTRMLFRSGSSKREYYWSSAERTYWSPGVVKAGMKEKVGGSAIITSLQAPEPLMHVYHE